MSLHETNMKIINQYHEYFDFCEKCYKEYLVYQNGSYNINDFDFKNIIFHIERNQFSLDIHIKQNMTETLWLQGLSHKGKKINISEIMDLFKEKAKSMFKRKSNDKKKQLISAINHLKHIEMIMAQYNYDFRNKKTSLDFEREIGLNQFEIIGDER